MTCLFRAHRFLLSLTACLLWAHFLTSSQLRSVRLSPPAGYLCVHTEKDESLGTTLILTWVPNSRIQRQDEEALRYITPESSPVRRNARRRGRR